MNGRMGDAPGGRPIRSIAIVGGGTAGWMAAAVLARVLNGACKITLIESADIPTVGVGEATIPPFVDLLALLGIDQADFVRHTDATYKLGIRFDDWLRPSTRYWHPFGTLGEALNQRPFFHAWHRARADGLEPCLTDHSACARLGEAGQFLGGQAAIDAGVRHALHFDAALVARYLRAYATALGVRRIEATITGVDLRDDGFLEAVRLADDRAEAADLFVDCSGFAALLIGKAMDTGWIDWSDLLPCDTAIVAPTAAARPRPPFTRAVAQSAGWRWSIPLRGRTGNGYVYCAAATDDEAAEAEFADTLGAAPTTALRRLRFGAGRRERVWVRNCVAVGLSSGFLEPLESTSIHLATSSVLALLDHFPDRDFDPLNMAAYNAAMAEEVDRARDFILLHYRLSARDDSPFWRQMRATAMPDSLAERVELYRATGRIRPRPGELFSDLSWFYVFEGMGVRPRFFDPLIAALPAAPFAATVRQIAGATAARCDAAQAHDAFLPDR